MKPIIGITVGDPNGIGPEISIKAALDKKIRAVCEPALIGSLATIRRTAAHIGKNMERIRLFDTGEFGRGLNFGQVSAAGGREAMAAIDKALALISAKKISAIVTAPISKEAVMQSGVRNFHGHTDYIAAFAKVREYCLALYHNGKTIAFVSLHVSLSEAIRQVTRANVQKTALILHQFLRSIGLQNPRIGVSGLNPHAGEGGMFGKEETEEIIPAVKQLMKRGIRISLPKPPDVVFAELFGNRYDGVVSMIHDHGHVAFKTALFSLQKKSGRTSGVNVTLGIPFVRTSVDHGTAMDIAGKNIADAGSLKDAIMLSVKMAGK